MSNINILSNTQLRTLSTLQSGRAILRIVAEFTLIFLAIGLHLTGIFSWWMLPLTLLFIGSRQHALLILMHEGAHFRLSTNRVTNEFLGSFIGWNFFASFHGYQRHHVGHHRLGDLNTMNDPDWARKQHAQWAFPMPVKNFAKIIVRDLLLLNTYDFVQEAKDAKNNDIHTKKDLYLQLGRLAYSLSLIGVLFYFGVIQWWLLFWLLPVFTTLKAILRIRGVVDHFCLKGDHPLSRSRTVTGTTIGTLLFAPCSIAYHGVHHLYASIPYYNLREAHEIMMSNSEYAKHSHISPNYLSAIQECTISGAV